MVPFQNPTGLSMKTWKFHRRSKERSAFFKTQHLAHGEWFHNKILIWIVTRVACSLASKNDFLDRCFKHFVSKSHRFCDNNYCNYFKWVIWLKVNRVLFHWKKSHFLFKNATWNSCLLIKCNFYWKCKTYLHLAFWREISQNLCDLESKC